MDYYYDRLLTITDTIINNLEKRPQNISNSLRDCLDKEGWNGKESRSAKLAEWMNFDCEFADSVENISCRQNLQE